MSITLTSEDASLTLTIDNVIGGGVGVTYYDTEAELLADTAADGVIGYARDTDVHYQRRDGAWVLIGSLTETSGPTVLVPGAITDGHLLRRSGTSIVGVTTWGIVEQIAQIYVDPAGNDANDGSSGAPIQTLAELAKRTPLLGEYVRVYLAAGNYTLTDWYGAGQLTSRTSFGSERSVLEMIGEMVTDTTFTVASASGLTITASGSPGWTTNEHRGKVIPITNFGLTFYHPITSNTANTVTVNIASSGVGGFYSLPSAATVLSIMEPGARILPSATNPTFFHNRFYFRGNVSFFGLDFDGNSTGHTGPTAMNAGTNYTFNACRFRRYSGRGLEPRGSGTVVGSVFDTITDAGLSIDIGSCQLNDCFARNCAQAYRATFQGIVLIGANSVLVAETITDAVLNAKSGGCVNDETKRVYLDGVVDYVLLNRGGRYLKVNDPLVEITGFGSPTRNVIRAESGCFVKLNDTPNQDLTPDGSYFHLNGIDVSLATYEANEHRMQDTYGNFVHDSTSDGI